jgi:hypothetical protein
MLVPNSAAEVLYGAAGACKRKHLQCAIRAQFWPNHDKTRNFTYKREQKNTLSVNHISPMLKVLRYECVGISYKKVAIII